jgi:hypothetical protein
LIIILVFKKDLGVRIRARARIRIRVRIKVGVRGRVRSKHSTVYANIFAAKIFGGQALKISFRGE